MSYLKHKPGSIEEMMANQAKKLNDNAYQDMFKKELEKAGRGIGAMSPKEKKDFFNKIDDKYKAKNEEEVSKKDVDKFHTSLDKLVHKSFGHSSDEKKKEVKEDLEELFGISSNANHRSKTIKMLDTMNIKHEKSGLNGLVIKGVDKDKQQNLLDKIKKDVGPFTTSTKEELEEKNKESIKEASYPH